MNVISLKSQCHSYEMSAPELVYFNGRGYAEIVRLILTACDIQFTEVELRSRDEYLSLKPELPFGQIPLLKYEGKLLVQSGAIVRHLARLHDLYGKDEDEKIGVDTCYEGTRDFLKPFTPVGVAYPFDKVVENTEFNVNQYLPLFEQILLKNGSNGYLVGESLTFADLGLLEVLLYVKDYYESAVFDAFPNVLKFLFKMSQQKFYKKYLKEHRAAIHTPELIAHVRNVLNY